VIGCSLEVLEYHSEQHRCQRVSPFPVPDVICECGIAVAITCSDCGDGVFVAVNPLRRPCVHVDQLVLGDDPTGRWSPVTESPDELVQRWSQ
jgi:hypothetical protein